MVKTFKLMLNDGKNITGYNPNYSRDERTGDIKISYETDTEVKFVEIPGCDFKGIEISEPKPAQSEPETTVEFLPESTVDTSFVVPFKVTKTKDEVTKVSFKKNTKRKLSKRYKKIEDTNATEVLTPQEVALGISKGKWLSDPKFTLNVFATVVANNDHQLKAGFKALYEEVKKSGRKEDKADKSIFPRFSEMRRLFSLINGHGIDSIKETFGDQYNNMFKVGARNTHKDIISVMGKPEADNVEDRL